MADQVNNLLRYAQSSGGSPYDEESYLPVTSPGRSSIRARNMYHRAMNHDYLGRTLGWDYESDDKSGPLLPEYAPARLDGKNLVGVRRDFSREGSDYDMLMIYGPEDQVAYDNIGRPIPLAHPSHPRNQQPAMPMYPQQGRR